MDTSPNPESRNTLGHRSNIHNILNATPAEDPVVIPAPSQASVTQPDTVRPVAATSLPVFNQSAPPHMPSLPYRNSLPSDTPQDTPSRQHLPPQPQSDVTLHSRLDTFFRELQTEYCQGLEVTEKARERAETDRKRWVDESAQHAQRILWRTIASASAPRSTFPPGESIQPTNTSYPVYQASSSQQSPSTARKQQKRRHHDTYEGDPRLTASTSFYVLQTSTPSTSTLPPSTLIPAARSCPSTVSELRSGGDITVKRTKILQADSQRAGQLHGNALPLSDIASPVQMKEKGKQRYRSPVSGQATVIASTSRSTAIEAGTPAFAFARASTSFIPHSSLLPVSYERTSIEVPASNPDMIGIGQVSSSVSLPRNCLRLD
jgi:hypothetical protein